MNRRAGAFAVLSACLAALTLAGCGQGSGSRSPSGGAGQTVNFSIVPAESQANMQRYWQPLLDDMHKQTGLAIKAFFVPNYSTMVQAMRFNQTQAGWFSAESAAEAVKRSNAEVFARTADEEGKDTYNSVILVRKNSGIDLARLLRCDKTLSFGMGDAVSTSGTLAPTYYLFRARHIDPNACFKTVRSAQHEANMLGVANGVLDAATNNTVGLLYYRTGERASREAVAKTQVIWTSPPLPEASFLYRKDLDPEIKAKLRDFITGYGKAPGPKGDRQRAILKGLHYSAFNPAHDSYLRPIIDMQQALAAARKPGA
jgi:phosphonate transport system substrate-binding protein